MLNEPKQSLENVEPQASDNESSKQIWQQPQLVDLSIEQTANTLGTPDDGFQDAS